MPDMLRRFWNRSPQSRIRSLECEAIRLLKARRLAERGYYETGGDKSLRFLDLLVQAEEKLDNVANELLEIEGK